MKVDLVLGVLPWALFSQLALAGRLVGRQGVTPTCASGNTYLVVPGDDCQKISLAKSVSTRALIATNNLNAECSNLIAGVRVCLPPSCSSRQVQAGDTCFSIAVATLTTTTAILSLNEGVDSTCSNLIAGEVLCVGPAGGNGTATPGVTGTTGPTATVAPTRGSNSTSSYETSASIGPTGTVSTIATTTAASSAVVSPPAPTPPGTASECSQYHTVVSGDYCSLLGSIYGITFEELRQLNPDLDAECTNLMLGVAYCVSGTAQGTTAARAVKARKRWIEDPHAYRR